MHSKRSLGEHRRHVSPLMWVRWPEVHCPEGLGATHLLTALGKERVGLGLPSCPRRCRCHLSLGALNLLDLVS